MKYLWTIVVAVILSAICNTLVAQEKSVEVSVDMEVVNGEEQRNILITIGEGNQTKEIKWSDNGTIPTDVKEQLKKEGIDINMLEGDGEVEVTVESDGDKKIEKEIEIIKIESSEHEGHHMSDQEIEVGDDGKAVIIKINKGEEIPADVRELLEEHDIDIDALMEDAMEEGKASQAKVIRKKAIKINSKDDDGNEKLIEWNGDEGEIPEDIRKLLEEEGIELDGDHEMIFIGDDGEVQEIDIKKSSKKQQYILKSIDENGEERILEWNGVGEMPEEFKNAEKGSKKEIRVIKKKSKKSNRGQLGVMIEEHPQGVKVIEVIKDMPADKLGIKVGAVITAADGKEIKSIDNLLDALRPFAPGEIVLLDYFYEDEKFQDVKAYLAKAEDHPNFFVFKDVPNTNKSTFALLNAVKECNPEKEVSKESNVEAEIEKKEIPANRTLSLRSFEAYPNPTTGMVNINFEGNKEHTVIQITDISGKEVYKDVVNNFDGVYNKDIDLAAHPKGQFILYVIQNQKIFTQSIILQ